MNEDNLNIEIRRFLKKVGIESQRVIEGQFHKAYKNGSLKIGDEVRLEMTLKIDKLNLENIISGKIKLD